METKKSSWTKSLFAYAQGQQQKMILSVILSVVSVSAGLIPFYCMYRVICLFAAGTAAAAGRPLLTCSRTCRCHSFRSMSALSRRIISCSGAPFWRISVSAIPRRRMRR